MVQLVVTSLSNASLYALLAVSLTVVYRSSGLLNFGAGFFAIAAGNFYVAALSPGVGGVLAVVAGTALALVAAYLVVVWWGETHGVGHVSLSLAMLGAGLLVEYGTNRVLAHGPRRADPFIDRSLDVAGTSFAADRVLMFVLVVVSLVLLAVFVDKTMIGHAIEAVADDRQLSRLYGVPSLAITCVAWALAGALLGLAGALQATLAVSSFDLAVPLVVIAAAAAVVGGLGSIGKVAVGAVIVAVLQAMSTQWISSRYSVSIVFVLLFVVLMVRPQGLLGAGRSAERV